MSEHAGIQLTISVKANSAQPMLCRSQNRRRRQEATQKPVIPAFAGMTFLALCVKNVPLAPLWRPAHV